MPNPYARLRRNRATSPSLRRDLFAAVVGIVTGEAVADDAASLTMRMVWGAVGAVGSILIVEACWFLYRFVWVTPAEMHAEDQRQISKLSRDLELATNPPGLVVQIRADDLSMPTPDGVCMASLSNSGVPDDFYLQVGYCLPGGYDYADSYVRWKGSKNHRHKVVSGKSAHLEFLRIEHKKDDSKPFEQRFSTTGVYLLTPNGDVPLAVAWHTPGRIMKPLYMWFTVVGALSGQSRDYGLSVFVATDGSAPPQVNMVFTEG